MAASLGSLVVSLGLDAAQFTSGLSRSEAEAKKFAATLDRHIATAATVAGAALVVMGGAALTAFAAINNLARRAGNFQDLAEKTGASSEALASYAVALDVAGSSAEDLANFSIKLSKNLAGVQDGTDKAGAALQALGLDISKFKALKPEEQIDALSVALGKFSDRGGGKASALEAIAKGGANLLPFLKELNEQGGRQITLTEEQIRQADAYADAQARAKAQLQLFAEAIAIRTLPAIIAVTGAAKEFIKELVNVEGKSSQLANDNSIENFADRGARALAFLVDAGTGVARTFEAMGVAIGGSFAFVSTVLDGDIKRSATILKDLRKDLQDIGNRPLFSTKLEAQIANRTAPAIAPKRPELKFDGAILNASKNILDGQIKALDAAIAREKDILNARADYLQDYFRDGFLSVADYYGKLQQARDAELANVIRFYDQEIAVQNAFRAKAKSPVERQDATNKIEDIREKQNKLLRDAVTAEEKLTRDRNRAAQEYADQLDELNAKMLELAGNTAAAAAIRFDNQNRLFLNTLKASGDQGAVAAVAALKQQAEAQGRLNDRTKEYSLTLGQVGLEQAKIDALLATGAITEIGAINERAAVAAAFVGTLRQQADAAELAANKLQGMDRLFALQNVDRFRIEIEQLAAASGVLAKKFDDIFASGFSNLITDLIDGTKSVKQAFLDTFKSIEQSISKIAAQNITEKLFGKDGSLGGIGQAFAGLFGGKAATASVDVSGGVRASAAAAADASVTALATSAAVADASVVALATSTTVADAGLVTLAASLATASAAALSFASSTAAESLGKVASFVDFGAFLAGGGVPPLGKVSIVGEDGPEFFIPKIAGTIVPANRLSEGKNVHVGAIHINVPAGTSRASADQIASATAAALRRAMARTS